MNFRLLINFLFLVLSTFLMLSCGPKEKKQEEKAEVEPLNSILGNWNAHWEMTGNDVKEFDDYQKKMSGKLRFYDNGEVEITTYGFDGCLFMTDTTTNVMNWKMEDKILRFIDKNDVHGIPCVIEEFEPNRIQLSLMGDIHLKLDR